MRATFDDAPVFHAPTPSETNESRDLNRESETRVQDPVSFLREVVKPMCDEDNHLARPRVAQLGQDVTLGDGIQRRRRFVDDDESRRAIVDTHERACAGASRVRSV